jgi:hypothetical protein
MMLRNPGRFWVIFVIALLMPFALFMAPTACAQGLIVGPSGPGGTYTFCDLFATGQRVLNFLVGPPGGLVFVLAVIGIMIGGMLIMVSGGNKELYSKGAFALKAAVIGLAIALSAWIIVNTIFLALAGGPRPPGFPWPWHQIRC